MCAPRLSRSEWTSTTKLLEAQLKQVISVSEPTPDEAQRAIGNSKGGGIGSRALSHLDILESSSSLRHVYGGYLSI